VLDNATIRRGIGQDKLDERMLQCQLALVRLPPYSPELNLIEIVWKQAKRHWRRFAA
jgi:transposase